MPNPEIKKYLKGWVLLHQFELQELRQLSIEDKFKKMLSIFALGFGLGMLNDKNVGESLSANWQTLKNRLL